MGRDNNSGNQDNVWAGKYRILVHKLTPEVIGSKIEFLVVNLKNDKIEMEHPGAVWANSTNSVRSMAALDKDGTTLSVLNIGLKEFQYSNSTLIKEKDYIPGNASDTCISTLDLTKAPPAWSDWSTAPKMNFMRALPPWAALGDKIFVFQYSLADTIDPEVYEISTRKWKKLTTPFGGHPLVPTPVISDPDNDRLIACLCNIRCLYAYYPKNNIWEWLHVNLPLEMFFGTILANEVVGNVIYSFLPDDKRFMGYDIVANRYIKVDWLVEFDRGEVRYMDPDDLVHLGDGIFCLVYEHLDLPSKTWNIKFLRFSVERVNEDAQLRYLSFHNIVIGDLRCITCSYIPF